MRGEEHFSAGGVVYKLVDGQIHVVLCGREQPPLWGLPKGTPNEGETPERTALREVREETGLEVSLEQELGEIEYWFGKPGARVHKRVKFYLMSPTGGRTEDHDPEFDLVVWYPYEEALKLMTYNTETEIMKKAFEQVRTR